ncbi:UDP-N-acetylmuramoyl-L-alanyl-D-glutamate--2,6-diaminopimelate ligase [Clostridium sp.]|uniref:UDP-N-acetylmuramoyl-L-alanyl-D-glutamate--2, 6-diaminopimelate ligase n=1 Tax=Clostridium sp. TaxID=1506 RepID=UPI003994471D
MLLKELLKNSKYSLVKGKDDIEIKNLCYDNRKVKDGDVFLCIKGFKVDGHSFIEDAIEKGAKVIVLEEDRNIDADITIIKVDNTRKALAEMSSNFFNNPKDKLKIIGVTGTNGKTTSAFIIKSILEKAGKKVGLIGTIANYIDDKKIHTERTTPESFELHELFAEMVKEDVEYCVMEVSSHSLDLYRVYGIEFETGIFTNLTRDHLDFHKTFENYYNAKFKLFKNSKLSLVNLDDSYGERVLEDLNKNKLDKVTFSINKNSEFKAYEVKNSANGSEFKLDINNNSEKFIINIPGLYNVHNALGCILTAYKLGIDLEFIKAGISDVTIPGRCEMVAKERNLPYSIIIDYAHTPDGLENILETIKGFAKGRIITVFGCGGDRDKVKRPQMGEIACKLSDIAIVTSDNPRTEEPIAIINDIINGLSYDNYIVVEKRYDAIEKAISIAKKDDVILIAGKGHETYQILATGTIDFDERKVVYEILDK